MFTIKNLLKTLSFIVVVTLAIYFAIDTIQNKQNIMSFEDYDPPSSLIVEGEVIKKAKYTFIDVHSHLWNMPVMDLDELVAEMDEINMGYIVNLSGSGFGPQAAKELYFDKSIKNIEENQPGRIGLFVNVDFNSIDVENHVENQVNLIRSAVSNGAIGLKVYKSLGLTNKDSNGNRVRVDDERLGPIWDVCGELSIPVLIHSCLLYTSPSPRD